MIITAFFFYILSSDSSLNLPSLSRICYFLLRQLISLLLVLRDLHFLMSLYLAFSMSLSCSFLKLMKRSFYFSYNLWKYSLHTPLKCLMKLRWHWLSSFLSWLWLVFNILYQECASVLIALLSYWSVLSAARYRFILSRLCFYSLSICLRILC